MVHDLIISRMRSGWGSSQTYKNKTGPWLPWKEQAIFEFQKPSLFKRGQEQNLSCEICVRIKNHFHIDSMVLHWASLWNWGLGQLENGLLVSYAVVIGSSRNALLKERSCTSQTAVQLELPLRASDLQSIGAALAHRLLLARDAVATRDSQRETFMQHNPNNLKDPTNM